MKPGNQLCSLRHTCFQAGWRGAVYILPLREDCWLDAQWWVSINIHLFGYLKASHTAKTHESRTHYAQIFVSTRSLHPMCNSLVDQTWTVSDCKWMCGLCVILGFERLKKIPTHYSWVGVHSLCMTMRGTHVGRQCLCVGTGSKLRTSSSVHWHLTFISRMNRASFHVHRGMKVLVRGTFTKCACLDALHQWFMRRACMECSWYTVPYLLVCVHVREISVIRLCL